MLKKLFSAVYVLGLLLCIFCAPISAIMLVCRACAVCAIPWIGCCVPLLIALAVSPFVIIAKIILDAGENPPQKRR